MTHYALSTILLHSVVDQYLDEGFYFYTTDYRVELKEYYHNALQHSVQSRARQSNRN